MSLEQPKDNSSLSGFILSNTDTISTAFDFLVTFCSFCVYSLVPGVWHLNFLNDIKTCYRLRWGIETSFRYLKHVNGLLYLHSKKPDFLKQEIYGNLILYNFGIFLANEAALEKQKQQLEIEQQHQSQNKYHYQVDFSSALRIARKYFWRDSRTEKDIIHLMIKYVHAVKEELRQFSRPLRGIGAVHFAFR